MAQENRLICAKQLHNKVKTPHMACFRSFQMRKASAKAKGLT